MRCFRSGCCRRCRIRGPVPVSILHSGGSVSQPRRSSPTAGRRAVRRYLAARELKRKSWRFHKKCVAKRRAHCGYSAGAGGFCGTLHWAAATLARQCRWLLAVAQAASAQQTDLGAGMQRGSNGTRSRRSPRTSMSRRVPKPYTAYNAVHRNMRRAATNGRVRAGANPVPHSWNPARHVCARCCASPGTRRGA